jgi:ribosome-associated protein
MSSTFKITIPEPELEFRFSRASGPGGQNVNKVETRAQLFFTIATSSVLSDDLKLRLRQTAKNQLNKEDQIVISSQSYRSQERNRHACIKKLKHLIEQAAHKPKNRKKTKPSKAAREKRLVNKKRKGGVKKLRNRNVNNDY